MTHKTLSYYLVRPNVTHGHSAGDANLGMYLIRVRRPYKPIVPRLVLAVGVWIYVILAGHAIISSINVAGSASTLTKNVPITQATAATSVGAAQTVSEIKILPSDPTGYMLPPEYMAPFDTYANDYDQGQCTWYVASRRKVPPNWGNADTWYGRAALAGWSVGTVPAVGAIAWTPAGFYGHVALVEQISANYSEVYISEMNYVGSGIISHRWVDTSSFKYIYN
jgi:surface antigen